MPGSPGKKRDIQKRFYKKVHKRLRKRVIYEDLSKHFLEYFLRMEHVFLKTVSGSAAINATPSFNDCFCLGSWAVFDGNASLKRTLRRPLVRHKIHYIYYLVPFKHSPKNWLFQLDDFKPLLGKWLLEITISNHSMFQV